MATLPELYDSCPSLRRVDHFIRTSGLQHRAWMLPKLPQGGISVELGVVTGLFSEAIIHIVKPKRLYLVDPWWTKYGDFYPDWGAYTDFGRLPTRIAYQATLARTAPSSTEVIVITEPSTKWAATIPDSHLDWAYIDTTHEYQDTWNELHALAPKIKPEGFIFGDDWQFSANHIHAGVMLAVNDFVRATEFDIRSAGAAGQWLIIRREDRQQHAKLMS